MKNVKNYLRLSKMIYLINFCTYFMLLVVMLCVTYSSIILLSTILSLLFVKILCLRVLIMKCIHEFQQNE